MRWSDRVTVKIERTAIKFRFIVTSFNILGRPMQIHSPHACAHQPTDYAKFKGFLQWTPHTTCPGATYCKDVNRCDLGIVPSMEKRELRLLSGGFE